MKTLVFSDTHLTARIDLPKLRFLRKVISQADMVVIAGDFWDGVLTSFGEFVNSGWRELFPLLKEKRAVYLYGNHDRKSYCDWRVNWFSDCQSSSYFLPFGSQELLIIHGHQLNFSFSKIIEKLRFWPLLINFQCLADHFFSRRLGRKYLYLTRHHYNQEIGPKAQKILKLNQILVCGHTHLLEKNLNRRFINLGCINYGLGQYLMVDDGRGELTLCDTSY